MLANTVRLRSVELGSGRAKLCVPLVADTVAGMREAAAALTIADLDLVELRADLLIGAAADPSVAASAVAAVRDALPDSVPILFTWRSTREGGGQRLSDAGYASLVGAAIAGGVVDAVDVEMLTPRADLDRLVALAHAAGVAVVMSNHEFSHTPPRAEIVDRLARQQQLGADVLKIAVMPLSPRDVITLLDATEEFATGLAERPVITMAMGGLGVVSRIGAEAFGSCMSFGAVGEGSAPGQVAAGELRRILNTVHEAMATQEPPAS